MKRIAIDFDGTLAKDPVPSTVWKAFELGAPLPGAIAWMKELIRNGYTPIIWSCRFSSAPFYETNSPEFRDIRDAVYRWLVKHGLDSREVVRVVIQDPRWGKPSAELYVDNKGWRFEGEYPSMDTVGSL